MRIFETIFVYLHDRKDTPIEDNKLFKLYKCKPINSEGHADSTKWCYIVEHVIGDFEEISVNEYNRLLSN